MHILVDFRATGRWCAKQAKYGVRASPRVPKRVSQSRNFSKIKKKFIKGLININSFKGSHKITKHQVDEPYDSSINNSAYNDARVQRCKFAPFYN